MIKFIHTADWHIRDMQYGRAFRGEDFRKAILSVVDIAVELEVDFIVNGGDTLHLNRPSETMIGFLCEVHKKLLNAGIPMYTVTGNHDTSSPSFLTLPEWVTDTRSNSEKPAGIVCVDHQVVEHCGVRIAGFPAIPFSEMVKGVEEMTRKPDVVLWHGAIEDFVPFPMKDSGLMCDLPLGGAKAWLLGDIHKRGRERHSDGSLVSYPGPVEMCERGEQAEKFVDLYRLGAGWRELPFPDPIECPVDVRPAIFLNVADDAQADQALAKIRKVIRENPGRSPLIFCRYEKSQKVFVNRVREIIDPRDTVFRAASYSASYQGEVTRGEMGARPRLLDVVDEVVPPGSPINLLSRSLIAPDCRQRPEIVTWVENQLALAKAAQA